jgi:hypothetical protein
MAVINSQNLALSRQNTAGQTTTAPVTTTDPFNTNSLLTGMGQNIADNLSGKTFDPIQSGMQQAEGVAEANQRASTAATINQNGFSGTQLGAQVGQGTENQILQNRFANNNTIATEKVAAQNAAAQQVPNYLTAQTAATNAAGTAFSTYATTHPNAANQSAQQLMSDPAFATAAQNLWTAQGGKGAVDPNWAKSNLTNAVNAGNPIIATNMMIDQAVAQGSMTSDQAKLFKTIFATTTASGGTANVDFTIDPTTGEIKINRIGSSGNGQAGVTTLVGGQSTTVPTTSSALQTLAVNASGTPNGSLLDSSGNIIFTSPSGGMDYNGLSAAIKSDAGDKSLLEAKDTSSGTGDVEYAVKQLAKGDVGYDNKWMTDGTAAANIGKWIQVNGKYYVIGQGTSAATNTATGPVLNLIDVSNGNNIQVTSKNASVTNTTTGSKYTF